MLLVWLYSMQSVISQNDRQSQSPPHKNMYCIKFPITKQTSLKQTLFVPVFKQKKKLYSVPTRFACALKRILNWSPFKPILFKTFLHTALLSNRCEGTCPNCAYFSEKFQSVHKNFKHQRTSRNVPQSQLCIIIWTLRVSS